MHLRAIICAILMLLAGAAGASLRADDLFTVSAIAVTGKDPDPAKAKIAAFEQAQSKGFAELATRLAGDRGARFAAGLASRDAGRLMASMQVEKESFGPGRYMATLTVAFKPDKVRELLTAQAIPFSEEASPPVLVIPVWQGQSGPVAWDDTPWRRAWKAAAANGGLTPVIIPLGDAEDMAAVPESVLQSPAPESFAALTKRYGASAVILARAEGLPSGGMRVSAGGQLPAAYVSVDERITPDVAKGADAARAEGVKRIIAAIARGWRAGAPAAAAPAAPANPAAPAVAEVPEAAPAAPAAAGEPVSILSGLAAAKAATATAPAAPGLAAAPAALSVPSAPAASPGADSPPPLTETVDGQALPPASGLVLAAPSVPVQPAIPAQPARPPIMVTVKFASIDEWLDLKARLAKVAGVSAVEPSAMAGDGAKLAISYSGDVDQLSQALAGQGLTLQKTGDDLLLARL